MTPSLRPPNNFKKTTHHRSHLVAARILPAAGESRSLFFQTGESMPRLFSRVRGGAIRFTLVLSLGVTEMKLAVVFPAVLLLLSQGSSAMAQTIKVEGQLSGGNNVYVVCTITNGQVTGSGALYGTNPSNGYKYSYPITVTKGTTAQGKLVLTGKIAGMYNMTLTSSVPNGPMVFSYVVNGNTYSFTGQGTVTVN
jgi:hypothetical protein